MKIILGLGNPGLKYKFSRHNLGFLVVEAVAGEIKIKINQKSANYLFGQAKRNNQKLLLVKPTTFVNLTGQAVRLILAQTKIELADLLIICDDINLPLGKIRIRASGSDGGHKGLGSIIQSLGTEDFPRLRVGVGAAGGQLTNYVLGRFSKQETEVVRETVAEAASCCRIWAKEGIVAAMEQYN